MSRSTVVLDAAWSLDITTVERAKPALDLKAATTEHDDYIAQLIKQCSGRADRYCDRRFIRQKYQDEFVDQRYSVFRLANPPVDEVVVTQGGSVLTEGVSYTLDKDAGLVRMSRHSGQFSFSGRGCSNTSLVVEYQGGFLAPPSTELGSLLREAAEVEDAVIRLVLAGFKARGRDPLLKAQEQPTLGRREWWIGAAPMAGGMPEEIAALLDDFVLGGAG